MELEQNLKLSSAAAAIAVSKKGAAASIPSKKEVLDTVEHLILNQ
jgi:sugar/nucleoside kinase (ribokinase family)